MGGGENLRRRGGLHVGGHIETPKRGAPADPDDTREAKKTKKLLAEMPLQKGDRVWTHCRVRPTDIAAGPGGMVDVVVKSKKPELGMIRSEVEDGCLIIQFESAEDEKERLEKFGEGAITCGRGTQKAIFGVCQ